MAWPALAVLALDQITKTIVVRHLALHEAVPVVSGFFNLVHVRNRGMAFGLFNHTAAGLGSYILIAVTAAAVIFLWLWAVRLKANEKHMLWGLAPILGGALGNLIDRLRFQEVIDFLDVHWGPYHWPAFNIADSAITLGTLWVAVCLIFHRPAR
jgi:signal peptidase II